MLSCKGLGTILISYCELRNINDVVAHVGRVITARTFHMGNQNREMLRVQLYMLQQSGMRFYASDTYSPEIPCSVDYVLH